jgi:hypothetical protein
MDHLTQYRTYRREGKDLNVRLINTCLTEEAAQKSARFLKGGRSGDDVNVFDEETLRDLRKDFALNEVQLDGTTAVESFCEQELWESDMEKEIAEALMQSETSLFRVMSVHEESGRLDMDDVLNDETGIGLTDIGLSKTVEPGGLLFCRLVRLEGVNITSGVVFPFPAEREDDLITVYEELRKELDANPESMVRFVSFYKMYKRFGKGIQILQFDE